MGDLYVFFCTRWLYIMELKISKGVALIPRAIFQKYLGFPSKILYESRQCIDQTKYAIKQTT